VLTTEESVVVEATGNAASYALRIMDDPENSGRNGDFALTQLEFRGKGQAN